MFQEEEPGKPQNWCFTITIIILISTVNLTIFVVIRLLLDSENEFNEAIIQGKLRANLTQFLGIFSLTFCFGCWCCFCCTGKCLRCFIYLDPRKWKFEKWWSTIIYTQKGHKKQSPKKREAKELDLDDFEISAEINPRDVANKPKQSSINDDDEEMDIERKVSSNSTSSVQHLEEDGNKAPDEHNGKNERYGNEKDQNEQKQLHQRPTTLVPSNKKCGETNREEKHRFAAERVRRWSFAPVNSDVMMVKMGGAGASAGLVGAEKRECRDVVAVRGVNFVQIPVEIFTPSPIGIVDSGTINDAFESEPQSRPPASHQTHGVSEEAKRKYSAR